MGTVCPTYWESTVRHGCGAMVNVSWGMPWTRCTLTHTHCISLSLSLTHSLQYISLTHSLYLTLTSSAHSLCTHSLTHFSLSLLPLLSLSLSLSPLLSLTVLSLTLTVLSFASLVHLITSPYSPAIPATGATLLAACHTSEPVNRKTRPVLRHAYVLSRKKRLTLLMPALLRGSPSSSFTTLHMQVHTPNSIPVGDALDRGRQLALCRSGGRHSGPRAIAAYGYGTCTSTNTLHGHSIAVPLDVGPGTRPDRNTGTSPGPGQG